MSLVPPPDPCPRCGRSDRSPFPTEMVSDAALLEELVRRGRVHPSRVRPHHVIRIAENGYHMTHPLSCDLSDCPYDHLAAAWDDPPRPPGTYWFPDVHTLERIDPEAGG